MQNLHYFSTEFIDFFKNLSQNNHKDWFDANRKTYENFVKKPFSEFIQNLIDHLKNEGFSIAPDAKDAIFRINRDVRFSKDKSPYKTHTSALLSSDGRKAINNPGYYLEFNADNIGIYSGLYAPDNQQIKKVRQHIVHFPESLEQIISNPMFIEKFGEIQGEKISRVPKEWQAIAESQPLIYHKQWYITAHLPSQTILNDNLIPLLTEYIKVAEPLQNFLSEALEME